MPIPKCEPRQILSPPTTFQEAKALQCEVVCDQDYMENLIKDLRSGVVTQDNFTEKEWSELKNLIGVSGSGYEYKNTAHHKGDICGFITFRNGYVKTYTPEGFPLQTHGFAAVYSQKNQSGGFVIVPKEKQETYVRSAYICADCHTPAKRTPEQQSNYNFISEGANEFCTQGCHTSTVHDICPSSVKLKDVGVAEYIKTCHPKPEKSYDLECASCHETPGTLAEEACTDSCHNSAAHETSPENVNWDEINIMQYKQLNWHPWNLNNIQEQCLPCHESAKPKYQEVQKKKKEIDLCLTCHED